MTEQDAQRVVERAERDAHIIGQILGKEYLDVVADIEACANKEVKAK